MYFFIAICCLLTGHIFKVLRWEQFIEIYERPRYRSLFSSLGWGYLFNLILPFRFGDIIRSILAGQKMKNGFGFALATVILDRILDVLVVGILFIFIFLFFTDNSNHTVDISIEFYAIFIGILFVLLIAMNIASKLIKRTAKSICSIFNTKIELSLLFFFWSMICTFRDVVKVNKVRLLLNSILMWSGYLASYYFIALFYKNSIGIESSFLVVFTNLFSTSSLNEIALNYDLITNKELQYSLLFHLIPVLGLLLISVLPKHFRKYFRSEKNEESKEYINLLPHIHQTDRLNFLETYFTDKRKDFLVKFVEINRDVNILQDFSSGSNATTFLCMDNEHSFYRKYAFGVDAFKLYEQVNWLKANEKKIPLPLIIKDIYQKDLCCYDMEYRSSAVVFFNYIHSNPIEKSWDILQKVLNTLNTSLYASYESSKSELTTKYIDKKVVTNIQRIKESKEIKPLLEYKELIINGRSYKNLSWFIEILSIENLKSIFSKDKYCEIHGDLTIENIICDTDSNALREFYIIDPNSNNIHNSPYLDYAKLLQSLHGGYEFLMKISNVEVKKNHINFIFTKSVAYNELYNHLIVYLQDKFGESGLKSIYYHEIVHWLRLLPYKIDKNPKQSVIFYAGLIMVLNDIEDKLDTKTI